MNGTILGVGNATVNQSAEDLTLMESIPRDTLPCLTQPLYWAVASTIQLCALLISPEFTILLRILSNRPLSFSVLLIISDSDAWNASTFQVDSVCFYVYSSPPSPPPRESTYLNSTAPVHQQPIYENGEVSP